MTRLSAWTMVPGILLAGLITVLFFASQIDREKQADIEKQLLELRQLETGLNENILAVRFGLSPHYDGVADGLTRIKKILGYLNSEAPYFSHCADLGCKDSLQRLTQIYTDKERVIESFKSQNAIFNLTFQYFPSAAKQLLADIINSPAYHSDLRLHEQYARISDLTREVGLSFKPGYLHRDYMSDLLTDIYAYRGTLKPHHQQQLMLLVSYARRLLSGGDQVDALLTKIFALSATTEITGFYDLFENHLYRILDKANSYRFLLFFVSLVLLLYLGDILFRLHQTNRQLQSTVRNLKFQKYALDEHAIVSATDVTGKITYVNDKFCEISQYTAAELIGENHRIIKSDNHPPEVFRDMWRTIARGKTWHGEICNQRKDGSFYWVASTIVPFLNEQAKPERYVGIRTDITQRKQAEQEIEVLARFAEESPGAILRIARDGTVLYSNLAGRPLLKQWNCAVSKPLPAEWKQQVASCLKSGTAQETEGLIEDRHISFFMVPIVDAGYVNIYCRDVTDRKRIENELSYQATHDTLTGLYNRKAFEQRLASLLDQTQREGTEHALLYLDLDQFKVVNDTCGHIAGDELLRQLSELMHHQLRSTDILARLGGDEFGVILANCRLQSAQQVAEKLRETVNVFRFAWEEKFFAIGVSIGLVPINRHNLDRAFLLSAADVACYAAKDHGRNRVHIYQQDDEDTVRREGEMHWVSRITQALQDDNFILYVQKIIPLQNAAEKSAHYEVLVRMQADNGEIIPPGAFIPAAERYGLMSAIDQWVITQVFNVFDDMYKGLIDCGPQTLAINLSGTSISDESLLAMIRQRLQTGAIPAPRICFEITETAAIANLSQAIRFIQSLKELGCQFALDDFGSGLSSFAYLKNLPVDYLKIDGSLVKDLHQNGIDRSMVSAIHEIGRSMGLHTIAEFVENDEALRHLREIGVDYAQGYGIERPFPLHQLLQNKQEPHSVVC